MHIRCNALWMPRAPEEISIHVLQCKLPSSKAICLVDNVCKFTDTDDIFFGLSVATSVELKYSLFSTIEFNIPWDMWFIIFAHHVLHFRGRNVYMQFSSHQELTTDQSSHGRNSDQVCHNYVLVWLVYYYIS